jgi:hypothetical protein
MGREDQGRAILPFRLPIANCQFPIEKGTHLPKPKCASFVAAGAILECQVAAKRSFTVVAGGTIQAASRKVFGRGGGADLARLRRARGKTMAIGAIQPFTSSMLRVTESVTERSRIRSGAAERFLVVANPA